MMFIRETIPNISSFIRHTFQIQDKSPCAVQTITIVANVDGAAFMQGVPENVKVSS